MSKPITIQLIDAGDRGELAALSQLWSILDQFDGRQRGRMLDYLCEVFPHTSGEHLQEGKDAGR